ncbi:MAG: type IX secretion system membrane protein PorP/SprF [Cytophagales bacterium]|nr:type IX secretion system membrane protein PorP/SprF [Cytophagales bacterium]
MKKILGFILLVCGAYVASAQQEQHYTQYMINPYTINPAMGGTEDFFDLKAGFRSQWVGLEGAPRTFYLSGHGTIGKEFRQYHHHGEHKAWHGVGGYIYNDVTGPISRSAFYASYAFNMPINKHIRLSVGAFVGGKQYKLSPDYFRNITDDGDPQLSGASNDFSKLVPDANLGAWLYSKDFYVGVSTFQILNNDIEFQGLYEDGIRDEVSSLAHHYFITGGVRLPMARNFDLIPSMAVKMVYPAPASIDLGIKAQFADKFFGGLSYRFTDSFAAIVGVTIKRQVDVSYSFDMTSSDLRNHHTGTHEIVVGYRFKHPKHIDCPSRFW